MVPAHDKCGAFDLVWKNKIFLPAGTGFSRLSSADTFLSCWKIKGSNNENLVLSSQAYLTSCSQALGKRPRSLCLSSLTIS